MANQVVGIDLSNAYYMELKLNVNNNTKTANAKIFLSPFIFAPPLPYTVISILILYYFITLEYHNHN